MRSLRVYSLPSQVPGVNSQVRTTQLRVPTKRLDIAAQTVEEENPKLISFYRSHLSVQQCQFPQYASHMLAGQLPIPDRPTDLPDNNQLAMRRPAWLPDLNRQRTHFTT